MTSDISAIARISYEAGVAPIDYAMAIVSLLVDSHAAYPDLDTDAITCRILGELLNAGWVMPVWPIPEPGEGEGP
jgi:hypothetical protein